MSFKNFSRLLSEVGSPGYFLLVHKKLKWPLLHLSNKVYYFRLESDFFSDFIRMSVPSFLIKNGSTDFLNKQKNLFDLLESEERKTKPSISTQVQVKEIDIQKSKKGKRKETKQFRGKESLFKEPIDLPLRFSKGYKVPDFQRNPHKWVKYSLADITQNEMSNETNTATALSFLKTIRMQRKVKSIKMEVDDSAKKQVGTSSSIHQFRAPIKKEKSECNEIIIENVKDSDKPVFKSSKLIMPEYVVGQINKKVKPIKKIKCEERVKEIYLDHIHEYDDE